MLLEASLFSGPLYKDLQQISHRARNLHGSHIPQLTHFLLYSMEFLYVKINYMHLCYVKIGATIYQSYGEMSLILTSIVFNCILPNLAEWRYIGQIKSGISGNLFHFLSLVFVFTLIWNDLNDFTQFNQSWRSSWIDHSARYNSNEKVEQNNFWWGITKLNKYYTLQSNISPKNWIYAWYFWQWIRT